MRYPGHAALCVCLTPASLLAQNLFLMEALWIRFFPLMAELRRQLHEHKVIGDIVRVESFNGMAFDFDEKHRLWNPGASARESCG